MSSSSPTSSSLSWFRGLDLHTKVSSDFVVRTKSGACVSLATVAISIVLFALEIRYYWSTEILEHMEVDPLRSLQMRVNFDVTFPSLPCAAVNMDTQDASGTSSHDVMHNIFKRRLYATGDPMVDVEESKFDGTPGTRKKGSGVLKTAADLVKEKQKAISEGRHSPAQPRVEGSEQAKGGWQKATQLEREKPVCGDCYGAGNPGECCDTCEQVKEVYRRKGWHFNMHGVSQCLQEGFSGDVKSQLEANEGCNVFGFLEVPKVNGNFHFGPGHGIQHSFGDSGELIDFTYKKFNISHKINTLSFGAYAPGVPGGILDNRVMTITEGAGMHQYFIKLVPTIYQKLGSQSDNIIKAFKLKEAAADAFDIHSFQYSVTEHLRKLEISAAQMEMATGLLPGIFFNYEMSPIRVRLEEKRRSLTHLLTNICAIVGGAFTVGSLIDSILSFVIEACTKDARKRQSMGGGLMSK
jgi:endoplasmic reticulum-Golgi intermediate compartment protein 3